MGELLPTKPMNNKEKPEPLQSTSPKKRSYQKPKLLKLGKVTQLTLKTGSQTDFGTGRFTP